MVNVVFDTEVVREIEGRCGADEVERLAVAVVDVVRIAREGVTAPIASATTLAQLNELVAAATLKLDADAISSIDAASAKA